MWIKMRLASILHLNQPIVLLILELLLSIESIIHFVFFESSLTWTEQLLGTLQKVRTSFDTFESCLVLDIAVEESIPLTIEYAASLDLVYHLLLLNVLYHLVGDFLLRFVFLHGLV